MFSCSGGWCYNEIDCWGRSNTTFGSSKNRPPNVTLDGLLSSDCSSNPEFCSMNRVYLIYCDGNSFSGNRNYPLTVRGLDGKEKQLFFRGKRILDETLKTLATSHYFNLASAKSVLLTGCSAGGLAAYLHTDYVHSQLRSKWAKTMRKFKSAPNIVENKGGPDNPDMSLLNREQTEEWKGWMQYLFLAYHYFHEKSVYNGVRCFISCYVWLTGFGNFSFFYLKRDYGIVRFLQMMWRLNFLVFWLSILLGNTYILYYINPLHTFYFVLTYAVMRLVESKNTEQFAIRCKLIVCSVIIFFVWEFPVVFEFVFGFLGESPILGAKSGVLHEWHFRTGLDHWSAMFGMVFALNYPVAQAWINRVEGKDLQRLTESVADNTEEYDAENNGVHSEMESLVEVSSKVKENAGGEEEAMKRANGKIEALRAPTSGGIAGQFLIPKLLLVVSLIIPTVVWGKTIFILPKRAYNELHPYFFFLPLLCYIVCRNLTPCLRRYHSTTLAFIVKPSIVITLLL